MFLVLNYYLDVYKDKDIFNFLCFKDNINRTINQIIKKDMKIKLDINCFDFRIVSISLKSKENLKIYLIGIIVKF